MDGKAALQQRLRDKIAGIRVQSGTVKIKKKSLHEKKASRETRRQRLARRRNARRKQARAKDAEAESTKTPKMEHTSEEATLKSIAFSDLKPTAPIKGDNKRKRKLAEKFRQLNIAQKEKAATHQFTQTGQGGQSVRQDRRRISLRCVKGVEDGMGSCVASCGWRKSDGRSQTPPAVHRRYL